jgi:mannosyltransferase
MGAKPSLCGRNCRVYGVSAITLMTAFLRFCNLGTLSLTGDEAYDVLFAGQSLQQILEGLRFVQPYPPLFHTGLHVWIQLAGCSELAVRYGAAMSSILLVPAVFALGIRLFGQRAAYLGALFTAVNPLVQWWGRDAHFYGYTVLGATLLNLAAISLWQSSSLPRPQTAVRWRQLRYAAVALGGLLTHYFIFFPWAALNLVAMVKTVTGHWAHRFAVKWWITQVFVILAYIPWLIWGAYALIVFNPPGMEQPFPWQAIEETLIAFILGQASFSTAHEAASHGTALAVLLASFLVVGLLRSWRRNYLRPSITLGMTILLAPLTLVYLLSFHRPMFDPKYTVIFVPTFLLLLSAAIIELAHWRPALGLLGAAFSIIVMSTASVAIMGDMRVAKSPDWRSSFAFIHRHAQNEDILVYNFPEAAILYYNNSELPVALIPSSARARPTTIETEIMAVAARYQRIWFIPLNRSWWDADGETLKWLQRHADKTEERFFRGVHVQAYLTPSAWTSTMTRQNAQFSNGIDLLGFQLTTEQSDLQEYPHSTSSPLTLAPGNNLMFSLYWQSSGPTDIPYTVFTHIIGPDGLIYGQWDNPPVGGTYPTVEWETGEMVVDQYTIPLTETAPPGVYHISVGMYDPVTGDRVSLHSRGEGKEGATQDSIQLKEEVWVQ